MALKTRERQDTPLTAAGSHDRIPGYDRSHDGLDQYEKDFNPAAVDGDKDLENQYYTPAIRDHERNTDRGADSRDDLNDREANPSSPPSDTSLSQGQSSNSKGSKKSKSMLDWANNHKGGLIGGAVGILSIGSFFIIPLPLKIIGIMDQVGSTSLGRVMQYVEKRAQKVFIQSVMDSLGFKDRRLVKGKGIASSIAKTMTARGFEKYLSSKQGVKFIKNADGTIGVSITEIGKNVEKILVKNGRSVEDIEKGFASTAEARKILRAITKDSLGWRGFIVRGKLVKWMMQYLGMNRLKPREPDKSKPPGEQVVNEALEDATDSIEAQGRSVEKALNIMEDPGKTGTDAEKAPAASNEAAHASAKEALTGSKGVLSDIKDAIRKMNDLPGELISKGLTKLMEKAGVDMSSKIAKALGTKAIPFWGEIVIAATVVVFLHSASKNIENGKLMLAVALPAAMLMATAAMKWQGIASQAKLGTLPYELYNYYAPFFDDISSSSLHNCQTKNFETGCDQQGLPAYRRLNQTTPSSIVEMTRLVNMFGYNIVGDFSSIYLISRLVFQIDNMVSDAGLAVIKGLMEANMAVADFISPGRKEEMKKQMNDILSFIASGAMDLLMKAFGLDMSPMNSGNKLFDMLFCGTTFIANLFAQVKAGGQTLDPKTLAMQTQRYLAEEQEEVNSKGPMYALFSPEAPRSFTNQLAERLPARSTVGGTVASMATSLLGFVAEVPSGLGGLLSKKTNAATYTTPEELVGGVAFGFTDEQLNQPLHDVVYDDQECPKNTYNEFWGVETAAPPSTCLIDKMAAQTVECSIDEAKMESSPDCNPDAMQEENSGQPGGEVTASGFAWPLGEAHWKGDKADYLSAHAISGSRFYANASAQILGAASDISKVSHAQPVYSMYDGTVLETNPGGQGGLSVESNINGKKFIVVYAHGINVTLQKGATVKAGQQIMGIGSVGNSSGDHLHIQFEYDNVPRCIQDLFIAMDKASVGSAGNKSQGGTDSATALAPSAPSGPTINLGAMPRANPGCSGRGSG